MLKVTVEGIYESDIGSGQKKYVNFNYTMELTREKTEGLETHIMRRFIPYLISKDKNKSSVPFSRIKSFMITNIEKIDKTSTIMGKDILTLNEWEIQDLACLFDLYEAPTYGKFSIIATRNKTAEAYLKKVLKVPMKTAMEKAQLDFFKQLPDGTFKLDFGDSKCLVTVPDGYFEKEEKQKKEKLTLSYFQKMGQTVANAVLAATGNQPLKNDQNANFPSMDDLTK